MGSDGVKVMVIGSKFMGRTHSNAWLKVSKFFDVPAPIMQVIAARNPDETAAFAQRWGWASGVTDWRAHLSEVDLVDIVTPNDVHAEQSIAALEAGRHVAVEKPLAGTLSDAIAMARAARSAEGRTFVWFNYRRVPAIALAHRLVKEGRLGRIYHARAAYLQSWGGPSTPLVWRFQGDVAGSGAHGDLNAHIIDAVRFVTGEEIETVTGSIEETFIKQRPLPDGGGAEISGAGGSGGGAGGAGQAMGESTVDDAVCFIGRLSGGAIASFEATRLATGYHNANRFEIHGEHGALRFNFERMNELDFYDANAGALAGWTTIDVTRGGDGHPYVGAWWPDSHGLGYEHTFINQAADILTMLAGGEPQVPMPDFEDALQTQAVLEAAIISAREQRAVVVAELLKDAS